MYYLWKELEHMIPTILNTQNRQKTTYRVLEMMQHSFLFKPTYEKVNHAKCVRVAEDIFI